MEQCSYCGFVLQASDGGCPNCGAAGNERRPLRADDPAPQQVVTHYEPARRRRTPRWLKPLLALLLVAALLSLPQAQPYLQQLDDLLASLSQYTDSRRYADIHGIRNLLAVDCL